MFLFRLSAVQREYRSSPASAGGLRPVDLDEVRLHYSLPSCERTHEKISGVRVES